MLLLVLNTKLAVNNVHTAKKDFYFAQSSTLNLCDYFVERGKCARLIYTG